MLTACGRPSGEGVRLMWTEGEPGGQKPDFFVDVRNGWPLSLRDIFFFLNKVTQIPVARGASQWAKIDESLQNVADKTGFTFDRTESLTICKHQRAINRTMQQKHKQKHMNTKVGLRRLTHFWDQHLGDGLHWIWSYFSFLIFLGFYTS